MNTKLKDDLAIPAPVNDVVKPAKDPNSNLGEVLDLTHFAQESNNTILPKSSGGLNKIIGLMGVSGGVGTTSLAIQMGYDLIKQGGKTPPSVAIIDLDFENGAVAPYLDMRSGLTHEDLNRAPETIDTALVTAFINEHKKTGLHILSSPNLIGGNDGADPETVLAILDKICDLFDVIIMDIPRIWRPWNHAAIGAADHFVLVTELTIPGIHRARHSIETIENMIDDMAAPSEVIITKMERRTFKNDIKLADATKILGRPLTGAICVDGDTTLRALNRGLPAGMVRIEGRYVRDTRNVLNFWKLEDRDFAKHVVK